MISPLYWFRKYKDLSVSILTFGLNCSISMLVNILLTRHYGVNGLGIFGVTIAVYWLLSQFIVQGLNLSVLKSVAQDKYNPQETSKVIYSALILGLLTAVSMAGLATLLSPWWWDYIPLAGSASSSDKFKYGILFYLGLSILSLNKIALASINGLDNIITFSKLNTLRFVMGLVNLPLLMLFKVPVQWLPVIAVFIGEGLLFLIYFRVLKTYYLQPFKWPKFEFLLKIWLFGLKIMFGSLYSEMNSKVLILLLGTVVNAKTAGLYNFMALFFEAYYQLCLIIRNIINPKIPGLYKKRKWPLLKKFLKNTVLRTYMGMSVLSLLVYPFFYVLSAQILDPADAKISQTVFFWGLLAYNLGSGFITLDGILGQLNRPFSQTLLNLVSMAILVAIIVLWAPSWGLMAAPLASAGVILFGITYISIQMVWQFKQRSIL
ncbi:MAG: oligosaccharide flippase family protein [Gammaproteobacteria bacterium]